MSIKENVLYCDFNYFSYILPFNLNVLTGYMLKKGKSWNTTVNIVVKINP